MSTVSDQLPDKPRPEPSAEHAPWWQALTQHRLVAQRCQSCHRLRLYPRPMCDECYSLEYDWSELSGQGKIHTWTVSHHAFDPAFKSELPYLTVTVDLSEGVRLHAPLIDADPGDVYVGMPVLVDYEDVDDTYTRLRFKRSE